MDIKDIISDVLENTFIMSLSTSKDNQPWATILAFVHDKDFNLFWMSDPSSRHSQDLATNPQAAVSISKTFSPSDDNVGLQIFGRVELVDDLGKELENTYLSKRSNLIYSPRHEVQGFLESWYKFTPEFIDVTYEPEWAYEKKRYNISQKQ